VLGFRHGAAPKKNSSAAELRSATAVASHATKSLVLFRSKSANFEERMMDKAPVPDARTVWELSKVAEEFRTEGTGEIVVFLAQLKRGFGVPAGDFLCGLLFFYRIELVHLMPNSITIISTFIHLCEAYLSIALHFHLWRHFFELKKTGKAEIVGSMGFMLRWNMKSEYDDLALPDNMAGNRGGSTSKTPHRRSRPGRGELQSRTRSGPAG
jgi:hypothetical protein